MNSKFRLEQKHLYLFSTLFTFGVIFLIYVFWNLDRFYDSPLIIIYLYGMGCFYFLISTVFGWLQTSTRSYRNILLFIMLDFVLMCISMKFIVYPAYVIGELSVLDLFYGSLVFAVIPTLIGCFLGVVLAVIRERSDSIFSRIGK